MSWRTGADDAGVPYYSATLFDPRERPTATPATGPTICATPCGSQRLCRRRWKTGIGSSRSCHHTRCLPTLSSRPPAASTCRWPLLPPCGATKRCRTGCATSWRSCTTRAPRWTSPCCTRRALLDAPLPTWTHRRLFLNRDGQDSQTRGASTRFGSSAAGAACAPAGGTRTARVAGRGRHRGATLAGRPPDSQCGRPSGSGLLRDGAGRGPHGSWRGVRGPRHPLRAELLLDEETPVGAAATMAAPGVLDFAVETNQDGEHVAAGRRSAARRRGR